MSGRWSPAFRALWVGSTVSNIGDGIRLTALPLLAVALTDSELLVALVSAAQFLPWLVVAPFAGAGVDRWDRRRVMWHVQLARAGIMGLLALVIAADAGAMWQIYAVAFLITAGELLVDPALIATVPLVVADDDLDAANGRIFAAHMVGNEFVGSAAGSVLFAWAPWVPFAVDSATYAASTERFRLLPGRPADVEVAQRFRDSMVEGWQFLRRHAVLWPLTLALAWRNVGSAGVFSILVVFFVDVLGGSEIGFGLMLAVGALGAAAGSMLADRFANTRRGVIIAGTSLVEGVAMILLGLVDSVLLAGVLWFAIAAPFGVLLPVALSIQQRLCPNHLLGRINTTGRIVTRTGFLVGAIASGVIASVFSVRVSLIASGLVVLSAAPLLAAAVRSVDSDEPAPKR